MRNFLTLPTKHVESHAGWLLQQKAGVPQTPGGELSKCHTA